MPSSVSPLLHNEPVRFINRDCDPQDSPPPYPVLGGYLPAARLHDRNRPLDVFVVGMFGVRADGEPLRGEDVLVSEEEGGRHPPTRSERGADHLVVQEQINTLKNSAFLNNTMLWTSHSAPITREMHCPRRTGFVGTAPWQRPRVTPCGRWSLRCHNPMGGMRSGCPGPRP
jgi:hypothetical protein